MQDNNMDYVPADIVKMLFDQSQKASESNTLAVKEMTEAVNELAKVMALPPTKRDILDEIKEHEEHCGIRVKETYTILDKMVVEEEKKQNSRKLEHDKENVNVVSILNSIKTTMDTMVSKVNIMIAVVLITFTLLTITYIFVNSHVNSNIKKVVEETIKENTINKGIQPNAIK
jgi:hypothetical protein